MPVAQLLLAPSSICVSGCQCPRRTQQKQCGSVVALPVKEYVAVLLPWLTGSVRSAATQLQLTIQQCCADCISSSGGKPVLRLQKNMKPTSCRMAAVLTPSTSASLACSSRFSWRSCASSTSGPPLPFDSAGVVCCLGSLACGLAPPRAAPALGLSPLGSSSLPHRCHWHSSPHCRHPNHRC